jgi:hypothetical protein
LQIPRPRDSPHAHLMFAVMAPQLPIPGCWTDQVGADYEIALQSKWKN